LKETEEKTNGRDNEDVTIEMNEDPKFWVRVSRRGQVMTTKLVSTEGKGCQGQVERVENVHVASLGD
jgi:hypothetical protein